MSKFLEGSRLSKQDKRKIMTLLQKIRKRDVRVAVIGLGYVGLPLAVEFTEAGFKVVGLDNNRERTNSLKKGVSYIEDVKSSVLHRLVKNGRLLPTSSYNELSETDVIIMCVPTPLRKTKTPDVSYVVSATKQIEKYITEPKLIILESTTYPGTTDELILDILKRKKRKVGEDFFLCYSAERVDPGNNKYSTVNIPKVIAGITPECLKLITALYSSVFKKVIPVSSTRVAETIKLLENTFRTVNIALVDEIALMCNKMKVDVWEVIKGASTKPFGFMPFYPGPGVGGACLPKDPHYLAWHARRHNFTSRFIDLASDITTKMPDYVAKKIKELLKDKQNKRVKNSKILLLGIAYKKDLGDTRDSPAFSVIRLLQKQKANIIYNDPYVSSITVGKKKYKSAKLSKKLLKSSDITVIITAHTKYPYKMIINNSPLVFDTRGITWGIAKDMNHVVRL